MYICCTCTWPCKYRYSVCIYTRTCIFPCSCSRSCSCTYMLMFMFMFTFMYVYAHVHVHVHVHVMFIFTAICLPMSILCHIHFHCHVHAYVYVMSCSFSWSRAFPCLCHVTRLDKATSLVNFEFFGKLSNSLPSRISFEANCFKRLKGLINPYSPMIGLWPEDCFIGISHTTGFVSQKLSHLRTVFYKIHRPY